MGQDQILDLFFENPTKEFHIREISKILEIPKTTVSYHIHKFLKKDLIIKQKKGVFTGFSSNENSEMFKLEKKQKSVKKLILSGLVDYLEKNLNPKCIILFGSFANAEYDKNSDIDIFIQASESTIDLDKFEKKLNHKINLFFEPNIKKLSPELLNNIINGVKIAGVIKIR